ncbi:MAG: hypothetical protein ABI785_08400 [Gemmatimonadales bacterium]
MSRTLLRTWAVALLGILAGEAQSQTPASNGEPTAIPPAEQQIAAAVLAAPEAMRAGATVLGYTPDGHLKRLRQGRGELVCLAGDPKAEKFHVACYHRSLEPFMARGRALRARGVTGDRVDSVRFAETRAGKLRLPRHPAMLYSLTGPPDSFDPATGTAPKAQPLFVVYIPYATAASTGLSAAPVEGGPWIMHPGTPKAHIMFQPRM